MREIDQTGEHVIHHEQRRVGGEPVALGGFDDRERGPRLQGGGDEIMAVMDVALDGEIGVARRDGAAVDGKARHRFRQRAAHLRAHRRRHRPRSP